MFVHGTTYTVYVYLTGVCRHLYTNGRVKLYVCHDCKPLAGVAGN